MKKLRNIQINKKTNKIIYQWMDGSYTKISLNEVEKMYLLLTSDLEIHTKLQNDNKEHGKFTTQII